MLKPTKTIRAIQALPVMGATVRRLYHFALRNIAPAQRATTYFGATMNVDLNDFLQATIFHYGVWEPDASTVFDAVIEPGDTVIDIGANIGYFTLLFGQNVGPEGRVIAIEAHPMIARFLRRNIVDNNLMNTTIENVAVTGIPGYVTLFEGSKGNLGSTSLLSSRCTGKPLQVKASTLMNLLADVDLNKVSVIKIDIEGAEGSVVEEILQNLDRFPQRLTLAIEANLTENGEWHDFFERFLEAGFKAARLDRDYDWDNVSAFQKANLTPIDHLEESVTDVLFYRGDERIQRLLRRRRDALPRRLEAAKRQRSNLEAQATQ